MSASRAAAALTRRRVRFQSEMPPADPTVLTLEDLRDQYCERTIHEAAKDLDVGLTALKRRCRVLGIRRWPYRTVRSSCGRRADPAPRACAATLTRRDRS